MATTQQRTVRQIVDTDGKPYQATITSNTWVGGKTVFAQPAHNNKVQAYTSGKAYFEALIAACKAATKEICITGWQVNWDALLAPGVTLYSLLCEVVQASQSVRIHVMPWDDTEPMQTYDDQTATVLRSINDRFKLNPARVHVNLSPGYASTNPRYFSHHQKQVVIDRKIAFIGGIDIAYGRYDDDRFDLKADAEGREAMNRYNGGIAQVQAIPAAKLVDPDLMSGAFDTAPVTDDLGREIAPSQAELERGRIEAGGVWQAKYQSAGTPNTVANSPRMAANTLDPTTLDAARQPRLPWQDAHLRIEGPAVRDLLHNFVLRWNIVADSKQKLAPVGVVADYPEAGKAHVQVLRSAPANHLAQENRRAPPEDRWKHPGTQDDIHRAMEQLIREARRFIYIENQFFVSAFGKEAPRSETLSPAAQFINTYGGGNQNDGAITAGKLNSRSKIGFGSIDRSETLQPPTNRICAALVERIGRAIVDAAKPHFHVYITLPVHSEGSLATASIAVQVYWTMQTLVFGSMSLLNGIRRHLKRRELMDQDIAQGKKTPGKHEDVLQEDNKDYESIPIEKCFEYVTLLNLRNWAQLGQRYETEQVYVHTKLMVVDDLYALVGSANVNDRSLLGEGDSELAVLVVDGESKRADINGAGSQREVRLFAHELRKSVWNKLFGITGNIRPATHLKQAVEQPGSPSSWRAIQAQAKANAELYEAAFAWVPRNTIVTSEERTDTAKILPTWDETLPSPSDAPRERKGNLASPMPFQPEFWTKPRHTASGVAGLSNTKGFITALPIEWTKGENVRFEYPTDLVADNEQAPATDSEEPRIARTDDGPTPSEETV